ncbi:MAG: hypothetical protein ACJA09_001230 [Alcanivorax sp.]|jgi:hypothetical protein
MKPLQHRETIALYQALSPKQLAALIRADWRRIEPGWDGEHFLYLKLCQRYAEMMARQWEVPLHGAGYVVRIMLPIDVIGQYDLETVAYEEHLEYRLPVSDLNAMNRHLLGDVRPVSAFLNNQSHAIPLSTHCLVNLLGEYHPERLDAHY